jgi:hypothetical protein
MLKTMKPLNITTQIVSFLERLNSLAMRMITWKHKEDQKDLNQVKGQV